MGYFNEGMKLLPKNLQNLKLQLDGNNIAAVDKEELKYCCCNSLTSLKKLQLVYF